MIYSVFNFDTKQYDYYEGNGEKFGQKPTYRNVKKTKSLKVEDVLPTVPINAKRIGSGLNPIERIAVLHNNNQLTGDDEQSKVNNSNLLFKLAIGATSIFLFKKLLISILK